MLAERPQHGRIRVLRDPRRTLALAIWSVLTLIAAVLISRRFAGAFSTQSPAAIPCFAATAAAFLGLSALNLWNSSESASRSLRARIIAIALTLISPFGLGVALWTHSSNFTAGYLGALFVGTASTAFVIHDTRGRKLTSASSVEPLACAPDTGQAQQLRPEPHSDRPRFETPPPNDLERASWQLAATDAAFAVTVEDEIEDEPDDSAVHEWMKRRQLPDGREIIEGAVQVRFAPGEKVAVAHVPFMPPLAARPSVDCHVVVDFEGRVRVAAAQTYGLRIEARRSADLSAAIAVDVTFSAETPAVQPRQVAAA